MERRGGSGLPLGNTPAIPRSCGGPGDGIGGKFPLQQGQFWAPNTKENGGNLPLLSFLDKGNFDVGAQNPGFLSALFGVNSPTTGPILEGPRGRTAGSKIQDLGDTEIWPTLARRGLPFRPYHSRAHLQDDGRRPNSLKILIH